MKLFIITGASKGLGAALLNFALSDNHLVISISRTKTLKHPNHFHITHDLSVSRGIEAKLDRALEKIDKKKVKEVYLINNAAVIEPIGDVESFEVPLLEKHLKVNLLTPMVLSRWPLKQFGKKKKTLITIVNIVSGAAFHPLINWSAYCSSKSGLKMFTDCLNLDYEARKNFKAISFSPGVMDTDMQTTIRKQSKKNFKNLERFKQLKQKKQLLSPDKVAEGLYHLIQSPQNFKDNHYDIRDL